MNSALVIAIIALLGSVSAAPKPLPCPKCAYRRGHSFISGPPVPPVYSYSSPVYSPVVHSSSVYSPPTSVITHSEPVITHTHSEPVITHHEPVFSAPAPVVQETVVSHAPSVVHHETVAHPEPVITHRQPYVIGSYTTTSVGSPEYIPVKTTITKSSAQRYHVKVPIEYNYEVERPVHHTTTVYNHAYRPATTTVVSRPSVVSAPVSSSFVSAPISTNYVSTAPATSFVSGAPVSSSYAPVYSNYISSPVSNDYVSLPASSTFVSSAPATSNYITAPGTTYVQKPIVTNTVVSSPTNSVYGASSAGYNKVYSSHTSNSMQHHHDEFLSESWR